MTELNPNHEVVQAMRGQWHKVVAMLMLRERTTRVEFTLEEMQRLFTQPKRNVVIFERGDVLHIRLVDDDEAQRLARQEGGLPV